SFDSVRVVDGGREGGLDGHVGWFGCAGRGCLALHDAFDGCEGAATDVRVVGADVEEEFGVVGGDVGGGARVDRADGDHDHVGGGDLAGGDGLEPQDGRGGHHDGVHGGLGARAVPASAVQGDADRVGRGERRAVAQAQHACPGGCHVLAQHHVGAAEPVEQAVVD